MSGDQKYNLAEERKSSLDVRMFEIDQRTGWTPWFRIVAAVTAAATSGAHRMWILMYVFSYSVSPAATNEKAEWRLLPTVVFQEFSSGERCKAAKSALEGSLKEAGAKLRSGLEDLKSIGKADPSQIIIAYNMECLPK
jgi:hypothetical protein